MTNSDTIETHQHIRRFFSGTLLSRLSGFGRDLAMAMAFGDHPSVAAFLVAYRFANLLRRLVAEGPFQSSFIPYFEELRVKDPAQAIAFFQKLTALFIISLVVIVGIAEIGIGLLCSLCSFTAQIREVLQLSQLFLPAMLFICLYGMNTSLLQCHAHFFLPGFAPLLCNATWIAGALFLAHRHPTSAMPTLALCIVAGFALQWLITLPTSLKYTSRSIKEWFTVRIPADVKRLLLSFSLAAVGVGATQINALIDALFARSAHPSGPVYLWYAIRIEQLALALFGIACVSAVVPKISRYIKENEHAQAHALCGLSFRRIISVMLPCTLGLLVLGGDALNLAYGRGHFSPAAVTHTTLCLWAYALGLLPSAMVILFSSLFYARNDYGFPTRASLFSILINIFLNALFILLLHMGAEAIALATSISAWINFFLLKRQARRLGWEPRLALRRIGHIASASGCGALCALVAHWPYPFAFPRETLQQGAQFFIPAFSFLLGIVAYAFVTKNKDLLEIARAFVYLPRKPHLQ